ncbi:MAG: hypothetical protein LBG59_02360 [Candidatus Peribacteria bacterium]|jgi:hypothetical protein|nr:hypothetical protein [Candidatus Peribacteria bacterium]
MKPIKKMFQKNLSSALVKSGLANTIKTVGKSMVMEGSTEALQQVVQNAFVKTVDENRSMMKDVGENALYGGIMGGMFGGLHAGYNNALANQKEATIEQQARDYVEGTTVEKT